MSLHTYSELADLADQAHRLTCVAFGHHEDAEPDNVAITLGDDTVIVDLDHPDIAAREQDLTPERLDGYAKQFARLAAAEGDRLTIVQHTYFDPETFFDHNAVEILDLTSGQVLVRAEQTINDAGRVIYEQGGVIPVHDTPVGPALAGPEELPLADELTTPVLTELLRRLSERDGHEKVSALLVQVAEGFDANAREYDKSGAFDPGSQEQIAAAARQLSACQLAERRYALQQADPETADTTMPF